MFRALLSLLILGCLGGTATANESALMRLADINGDRIVFTYEDDLWIVSVQGGLAHRITRDAGTESYARFSPDGTKLAFTANYDGGTDVYVMDATGGVPTRLTFAPGRDRVVDWYPDGSAILFRANRVAPFRAEELYRISIDGGMPERVPIDRGGLASLNADATKLAYNRISRENATWKRYKGGEAQEIWIADFPSGKITRLTDWEGTDNYPMWYGGKVYFTSDRYEGTLNLFSQDPATGDVQRLTNFDDYDVKYPAMGEGRIIFQYDGRLHVFDLADGSDREVSIQIPSDEVLMRPDWIDVSSRSGSFGLSPDGSRAVVESRGEILVYPVKAEDGDAFNLTHSSASREKNAVISPDGESIAYVSDVGGEEQVWIAPADGKGEARQLTHREGGFIRHLVWSPDSQNLLFSDKFLALYILDTDGGNVRLVDQGHWDDAWERWGITDYTFSPDGAWIAYDKQSANMNEGIYLVRTKGGDPVRVTDSLYASWSPSFSPDGSYLYFLSNRTFHPIMGRQDQNHIFLDVCRPYMVLLRSDQTSPFREGDSESDESEDAGGDSSDTPATRIDLEGIQNRILACEGVEPGDWWRLESTEDGFLMVAIAERPFLKYQSINDHTTEATNLWGYTLDDAKAEELLPGIWNYHLSADGKKLIYRSPQGYGVVDAGKKASLGDGKLDLSTLQIKLTRREEYRQMFDEAWRIERDWFYDPDMHGVDWKAMHDKYRPLVDFCGTRGDLVYLIGQMIAELNIGHTYVYGGDYQGGGKRVRVGMLGCDFAAGDGYYKISHIVRGLNWDPADYSPLAEPGCPIAEGDYLLAIDGVKIPVGSNVYAQLVDKAGKWVTLTTNSRPRLEGAKTWRVKTLSQEFGLRYRAWVEANRAKVDEWSHGQIGYVYLPDMSESGLSEFGRYWYPQTGKKAILIDDRYNGGGFTGDMIVDRLERRLWGITVPREGGYGDNPERVLNGPLLVLINEDTGSNGEYFARCIQLKSLATVMGMRTWGGAVGIEPHEDLVDGGTVTPPQFGLYGLDGKWLIEGIGVVPDIEVQNEPASVVAGEDMQLRAGVDHLLRQLAEHGDQWKIPPRPAFPNKAKASGR